MQEGNKLYNNPVVDKLQNIKNTVTNKLNENNTAEV